MTDYRPAMQHQGPATNCVLQGKQLGWLSCTSYSGAMGVDQATRGKTKVSGCQVRENTGDYIGGLNLTQIQEAVQSYTTTELRSGNNVCFPEYAARKCAANQGFALQGNTSALLTTAFRSTDKGVNHCVFVSSVRGGTPEKPDAAYVYDPAADGRRSNISSGPQWWPWSVVLTFAAALRPWGDADPRTLGPGKFYALLFAATPPAPVVHKFRLHVAHNAKVRVVHKSGDCVASWTDSVWTGANSSADCNAPVRLRLCAGVTDPTEVRRRITTVLVTSGKFKGKRVRVGQGVTVSEVT